MTTEQLLQRILDKSAEAANDDAIYTSAVLLELHAELQAELLSETKPINLLDGDNLFNAISKIANPQP